MNDECPWNVESWRTGRVRHRIEGRRVKPQIWALTADSDRSLEGAGWVRFLSEGDMALSGDLHVSISRRVQFGSAAFVTVMLIAMKLTDIGKLAAVMLFLAVLMVWLLLFVLYHRSRGYNQPVPMPYVIRPDGVRSIAATGPILTIRLHANVVPGVSTLRLYVAPGDREAFFFDFDAAFPGRLPHSYRDALAERLAKRDSGRAFLHVGEPPPPPTPELYP